MNTFLSPQPFCQQPGLATIRIVMSLFLIYHGWELFFPEKINEYQQWTPFQSGFGHLMVYAGKTAELIAGILFLLGLLTRVAAVLTIGVMLFISFKVGNGIVWNNDQHPFLFVLLSLAFIFTGPGKWSVDQQIFKNK